MKTYTKDYFYDAENKFLPERAKDAIEEFAKFHGYPVYEGFRNSLWVSDMGVGDFTKVGIGVNMVANDEDDRYMLQEIFMLPHTMLPEHCHVSPDGIVPVKMEGWFIRFGKSYIAGIGEDNLAEYPEVVIPANHNNGTVTVKHITPALPGQFIPLVKKESYHWQFAGAEGAIMSEVANYHSNAGCRHMDPAIQKAFEVGDKM